ncbi:crotonase/enoyl-CoA hydratase family protein [Mycobacterium sp.]|uniref:crotonase/enoyl-CoA hydratase family protein n=1 Tax=Mycobacterium sp. TaxID=1785 RepID=UPI003BAF32AE
MPAVGATYEHIRYEVSDHVLTITLDRPERLNAFTDLMAVELVDAFDRADADDDVRAVVMTGAGRGFCAGADLESGGDTFDFADETEYRDTGGTVSLRIFESVKPVIAAINGPAVGVGISMTLPADVRLASDTARFGFVFARRGIVLDAASSWFLPRAVGISRALEWTATGRVFDAAEALDAGLVRSVYPPEDLLPAAYAVAAEIVANTAPVSVALNRQMLWRMLGAEHPMVAHELDSRLGQSRGASADAKEGVTAFLEKRGAQFPDRVSVDMPADYPWWEPRPFRSSPS